MDALLEIVCIDDEPQMLDLYEGILGVSSFPVRTFGSSVEAKSYIEKKCDSIGAIVCDYRMPAIDGISLVNDVHSRFGNLPFVLVSGHLDDLALKGIEDRISGHFAKPFDPAALRGTVLSIVEKTKILHAEKIEIGMGFAEEALPKVIELERLFMEFERDPRNGKNIQAVYRILHTLKGTAASVGLSYLAIFCHGFEARMLDIREGKEEPSSSLISVCLAAQAQLMHYFSELRRGNLEEMPPFENLLLDQAETRAISSSVGSAKVSVSVEVLADFLKGVGDLVILRNLMLQKIEILERGSMGTHEERRFFFKTLEEMHKVQSNLQSQASALLRVPFANLVPSLRRNIRDLAAKLGKKVILEVEGEATLFNHSTLQALADSLVHILRNSVDHGFESPAERVSRGKSSEGSVVVKISEAGEKTRILIEDDGKGISPERVAQKALEKGLRTSEALKSMSGEHVISLIFEPGFSTADQVTEVSGRGVGLDSVQKSIEHIDGSVAVRSTVGEGTTFEIHVPKNQTLNIVKTVIGRSSKSDLVALPGDELLAVESISAARSENQILNLDGENFYHFSGEYIQLLQLSRSGDAGVVLVLRKEKITVALGIEDVEGTEEIVLRDLDPLALASGMYERAAISGRHGVLLFLDTKTVHRMLQQKGQIQ